MKRQLPPWVTAVLLPPSAGGTELLGSHGGVSKPLVEPKVPLQAACAKGGPHRGWQAGRSLPGRDSHFPEGRHGPGAGGFSSTMCHTQLRGASPLPCPLRHLLDFSHPSTSQPSRTHFLHCSRDRDSRKIAQIYLKAFKA